MQAAAVSGFFHPALQVYRKNIVVPSTVEGLKRFYVRGLKAPRSRYPVLLEMKLPSRRRKEDKNVSGAAGQGDVHPMAGTGTVAATGDALMNTRAVACGCIVLVVLLCSCGRSPEARRDKFVASGKGYLSKRDFARAKVEFSNAVKAMPNDAEPYYYLGMAARQSGDLQSAVYAFQKALALNPEHVEAKLRLTQIMAAVGNRSITEDARTQIRALMENTPVSADMLMTLAVAELRLGQAEDAEAVLQQLLANAPGQLRASILLARAKLLQKDVKGAEQALLKAAESTPNLVDAQVVLARFYVGLNRTTDAEQTLRRALQIHPRNGIALFEMGTLHNRSGRKKEAEEHFRKLSGLGGDRYQPAYAFFLFSEGRRDEAVREFERLARQNPSDRLARTRLVAAYVAAKKNADAQKIIDDALRKNGKDFEARLQRGQMLTSAGKYADAETDLNVALQQRPDSAAGHHAMANLHQARGLTLQYRQSLTRALELNPNLLSVRLELAGALIASKNPKAALDILDQTPERQRSMEILTQRNWALWASGNMREMRKGIDAGLARSRSAELLIQDGLWKLQNGSVPAARASLEDALDMNPGDMRALTGLKQAYVLQRQLPAAVAKVKEYAAQRPKAAPVQQFLGFLLWAGGDRSAARAAFTAAKDADPKFYQADFALAQMDAVDANWDAAAERLSSLLSSDADNSKARVWLGIVEMMRKNPGVALEHFRRAVQADPGNAQALINLAYLLSEHANKPAEALQYAAKAQELAPDQPQYMGTLGWILYRKGLYPSALQYLERAASTGKDPVLKYRLAMAYAKSGKVKRGRDMLAQALKQNPNLPEAGMAKAILASSGAP